MAVVVGRASVVDVVSLRALSEVVEITTVVDSTS